MTRRLALGCDRAVPLGLREIVRCTTSGGEGTELRSSGTTRIHASSRGANGGAKWRDFHPLTRNCTTLIRDALVSYGFSGIRGRFPRDLYVSCAYELSREPGLRVEFVTLNQLKVAEAPYSARTLLLNPIGYWHQTRLPESVRI